MGQRTCLVCGLPADSKEHYIPKWLSIATERGQDQFDIGTAVNGQVINQAKRGTSLNAVHRNLCVSCNNTLGGNLESPIKRLLTPFVSKKPVDDWTGQLRTITLPERIQLGWWAALRAVQLSEQFSDPRILPPLKAELLNVIRRVKDAEIPALPVGAHLEIARSRESDWGFTMTRHIFDRQSGNTAAHPKSLLWGMQANHCLLVLVLAPEAILLRDEGWGYRLAALDFKPCPLYNNMADMLSRSHIMTSFWVKAD